MKNSKNNMPLWANRADSERADKIEDSSEFMISLSEEVKVLTGEIRKLSSVATPSVIKGLQGLADFLGVSKSVAQKMKNEGTIPYYQHDRVVLFKPDEVFHCIS